MSVSRVTCKAVVRGKGEMEIDLYKHLAPVTISAILRELPLNARVTIYPKAMVCILTGLRSGVEKPRYQFSRGEVAFLAANGSICFFTSPANSKTPLNPIGKIGRNEALLESLVPGDVMEVSQALASDVQT